ncbi:MAG: TonB-dependent receptor [Bacteroidota bacterium]
MMQQLTTRLFAWGLVLMFSLSQFPLFAQEDLVTVTGQVVDSETNSPLIGATLVTKGGLVGQLTDEEGKFSIQLDRSSFPLELVVTYIGYEANNFQVDLSSYRDIRIPLSAEGVSIDDVVITASKGFEQSQADLTASIQVVKPRAIDLQALPSVDDAISLIPGVDNQDGQINIRGSSGYAYGVGSRVMVTLDGLPLITGDAASASLDLVPVDNIAQIEVLKGASSVLYGSAALGGVINVITSDAQATPRTVLRVRGGIFDQPANPALDWDGDDNARSGSIHLFHSRQLFKGSKLGPVDFTLQANAIKETGYRQGTDTEEYRGVAMLKWRPIKGLTLGVNTSISIDSSGQILYWDGYFPDTLIENGQTIVSGGALTPTQDDGGFRRQLQVQTAIDPVVKYVNDKGQMFWYRGRYLTTNNQNNTNQSTRSSIFYNDFLYQMPVAKKLNWISGVTYTASTINGDSLYGGEYVFNGDTISSNGDHTGNSLGIYTQLDGKFGKLNTNLGIRYESVQIDNSAREALPVFRAGLNYEIAKGTNVRASVGQAFRVPSIAERFANTSGGGVIVEPNPSIGSERGYSAEVGFRQGFATKGPKSSIKGYLDIAAFRMQYEDMVEFGVSPSNTFDPLSGNFDVGFSSINVADARITGAELTGLFAGQFGDAFVNLSGGIMYIDPQNLNPAPPDSQVDLSQGDGDVLNLFNGNKVDRPSFLKYRQNWTIRASLSVGYGPVSLTGNYRYKSFTETIDQYLLVVIPDLREFRTFYPEGTTVLDLILNWDVNPTHQISFIVNNALNEEYTVIPGFLAPQRKFTIQYRLQL